MPALRIPWAAAVAVNGTASFLVRAMRNPRPGREPPLLRSLPPYSPPRVPLHQLDRRPLKQPLSLSARKIAISLEIKPNAPEMEGNDPRALSSVLLSFLDLSSRKFASALCFLASTESPALRQTSVSKEDTERRPDLTREAECRLLPSAARARRATPAA